MRFSSVLNLHNFTVINIDHQQCSTKHLYLPVAAISSGQQDRKYTYYMPAIPGGVGLDRKQANSVLGVSKRNGNTGVVCECCVHRCKRSEMMQYCAPSGRRRRNVRRQITDEDIERFYDQLDSMRADDSQQDSALSYDEFEQQPIVKLLEQYKQINIAREESTETNSAGDEYGSNMADEKASQNKMSDYLRESLIRLLAKSESSVPVKSSPHLTAQENADLHSLWELFENDGKK